MYSRQLPLCLLTMLIAGCRNRGSVPVITDTACDQVKPVYFTYHDINVMDNQTKKDMLAHNQRWFANFQQICSSPKAK